MTHRFAALVAWACEQFAAHGIGDPAPLVNLAAGVDQAIALTEQVCGFEFHHDGSGRVDLQVLTDSLQNTAFGPSVELPDWFVPLLQRCTDSSFAEPAGTRAALAFSAQHWLAFDRTGTGLRLGGIWQRIVPHLQDTPAHERTEIWIDQLATFLAGTPVDVGRLRRSAGLRHLVDTLGMPSWVGIMSGRGPLLKIMAKSPAQAEAYARFFARPELAVTIERGVCPEAGLFCRALADAAEELRPRIILDIDLHADRFLPAFGIEVVPVRARRGVLPDSLTAFLTNLIGLDRAALERAVALMACLPAGRQVAYTLGGLEEFLAPALTRERYTARLSHLKVVVAPDLPPKLKTYVGLTLDAGAIEHA